MGKSLLILIAGAFMIFALTRLNINRSNIEMTENSVDVYDGNIAKNLAASGIEFALMKLSEDSTWTGVNDKAVKGGYISVKVEPTSSKYYGAASSGLKYAKLVTSIGKINSKTDTVRAVVQFPESIPDFLKYAVITDKNLVIDQNTKITTDDPGLNANIHTNKSFEGKSGNYVVQGFLSYVQNAQGNTNNIIPNYNPKGVSATKKISYVKLPDVKASDYISKATDVYEGDANFTTKTDLGTKENPKIVYVKGNLKLSGKVAGYGIILVKGNVKVTGTVTIESEEINGQNIGLYSEGPIEILGNVTVKGQLYCNSDFTMGGSSQLFGTVVAKGNIYFGSSCAIKYVPASSNLTGSFWGDEMKPANKPIVLSYYK